MGRKKKETDYISIIREYCEKAGTYQPFFEPIITQLSQIIERRNVAYNQFVLGGCKMLVPYTNKGNAENEIPNPLLKIINEHDKLALDFWKELGLTPKALRSLNESANSTKVQQGSLTASIFNIEKRYGKSTG